MGSVCSGSGLCLFVVSVVCLGHKISFTLEISRPQLTRDPLLLTLPPISSKHLSFIWLYLSMHMPLFSRIDEETHMCFVENLEKH